MEKKPEIKESEFSRKVGEKESLKLKARNNSGRSVLYGLGMFGLVGWSVAFPTVAGALIGIWLDKHYVVKHSWTLSLLVAGLILGCAFAWHWIAREDKKIQKDKAKKDE